LTLAARTGDGDLLGGRRVVRGAVIKVNWGLGLLRDTGSATLGMRFGWNMVWGSARGRALPIGTCVNRHICQTRHVWMSSKSRWRSV
jgi:hypothetical protein